MGKRDGAILQNVSFCREYWRKTGFLVDINISLLEHVSPIEWENVILYGQYVTQPGRHALKPTLKAIVCRVELLNGGFRATVVVPDFLNRLRWSKCESILIIDKMITMI
jgi:hypothetical protein